MLIVNSQFILDTSENGETSDEQDKRSPISKTGNIDRTFVKFTDYLPTETN